MKLIDKIKEMNSSMNAINNGIQQFAKEQSVLKQYLTALARTKIQAPKEITLDAESHRHLTKEQLLEAFAEETEKQLIEVDRPSQTESLQEIILSRKNNSEEEDDLGTESDESIPLQAEEGSIVPDHDALEKDRQIELAKTGKQESFSMSITLNAKQMIAKELAFAGKSFCYIGPAGCGKTTGARAIASELLKSDRLSISSFKLPMHLRTSDNPFISAPSVAFVAYTRRAAANLAKAIWKDPFLEEKLAFNIMTVHALLEYEPEEYYDPTEQKTKFRFVPRRTAANPLNITHLIIEEASMLDALILWDKLYEALPAGVQIIFIGDINQLPPVFGPSILNYALMQLPIVELTEVYRNQGIVLENAHHILKGETLEENDNYRIVRGKNPTQLSQYKTSMALKTLFKTSNEVIGDDGLLEYDPEDCMILSPFNKHELGTDNMNKHIAQFIGDSREAVVYEIIAGFNKLYLAVGDRVMYNKRDAIITKIRPNLNYHGRDPQAEGVDLSRHGFRILGKHQMAAFDEEPAGKINYTDFNLEAIENEEAGRKMQASHIVEILYDGGMTDSLKSAGDFATQVFSLGYCLTVHKAQGSEWRKVFIILHKEHAVMLYRELFYTAATRARTKVTILAKDYIIEKAIKNQRIKGNTLADKLEFFNNGVDQLTNIQCIKI